MSDLPKILIVDDIPANIFSMQQMLHSVKAELISANSGQEALALILRHDFALMILDVQMPEMDGVELATLVRQNESTKSVPIIFVTAVSKDEKWVFGGYDAGGVDYLFKPIEPKILMGKVRVFLELYQRDKKNRDLLEELKAVKSKLEFSNRELVNFAHIVSHDLKEPLRGIRNFTQFFVDDHREQLSADSIKQMERIVGLSDRMAQLIDGILSYSKVDTVELAYQKCSVGDIVEGVAQSLMMRLEEEKVELRIRGPFPECVADSVRLGEVFRNLMTNAMKYNDKTEKWVEVGFCQEKGAFYVKDNGIGIPDSKKELVFKDFQRLHGKDEYGGGSGIGMSIVQRIVERHEGKIWLESEEGVGSTFFFTLSQQPVCPSGPKVAVE